MKIYKLKDKSDRVQRYLYAYIAREYERKTFKEIGQSLGVSSSRAQQIYISGKRINDFRWKKFYKGLYPKPESQLHPELQDC